MLTAETTRESVLKGFAIGADGYITKPADPETLVRSVHAVLGRHREPDHRFVAPTARSESTLELLPPLDFEDSNHREPEWLPGDPIPVPEAIVKDTNSGWALWEEAEQRLEAQFAPTQPCRKEGVDVRDVHWAQTVPAARDHRPAVIRRTWMARPAPAPLSLDLAKVIARRNNRACPRVERWADLSALLHAPVAGSKFPPPPPPFGGEAWEAASPFEKRLRLLEQLEWADRAGVLAPVADFMQKLPEDAWLHMGEE
jgi:hypothetical protein